MTTKGLFGFRKNGVQKVTYCHRESYPGGLGSKVVAFCRSTSIEKMNELFEVIIMVDDEEKMTPQQVQAYKNYLPQEYWNENLDWNTVLKYSKDPTRPLTDGFKFMVEYGSFLGSMRCRWIYIINLDTQKLEVYKNGLEKLGIATDVDPGRYLTKEALIPVLAGEFPLNQIPDDWLDIVTK